MVADSRSVFIVDDHLNIQKMLSDILGCLGYNTITASDGFEAVQTYREKKDQIGVVLLDVIMPGMNGVRTLKKLKEIDPRVKVILCSAYVQLSQLDELESSDIYGFLSKPYTMGLLAEKMEMVLSA